jgi:predicted enzyme related to lactoylglutathione lyase
VVAKVVSLGGVFFKCDADAARAWYERVLGVRFSEWGSAELPVPADGVTVLSPFKRDTDYFAPSNQPFMINLRVDGLDGVVERIEREGETILGRQDEPYGRFAWLMGPEDVKIELWEPAAE